MAWTKVKTDLTRSEIASMGVRVQDVEPEVHVRASKKLVEYIFILRMDPDGDGIKDRYVKVCDWMQNQNATEKYPGSMFKRIFSVDTCGGQADLCDEEITAQFADGINTQINEVGYEVYVGAFLGGTAEQIALVDRSGKVMLFEWE